MCLIYYIKHRRASFAHPPRELLIGDTAAAKVYPRRLGEAYDSSRQLISPEPRSTLVDS